MAERKLNNPFKNLSDTVKWWAMLITNATIVVGAIVGAVNFFLGPLGEDLKELERATVRSELLTLMANYPKETKAIEELAYHYFVDLKANSYVYYFYVEWAKNNDIDYKLIQDLHQLTKG